MRTSRIKHAVPFGRPAFKNSSAEANASALNPTDFRKLLSASRTDSSSSTIEILWISGTAAFHVPGGDPAHCSRPEHHEDIFLYHTLVYALLDGRTTAGAWDSLIH